MSMIIAASTSVNTAAVAIVAVDTVLALHDVIIYMLLIAK